MTNRSNGWESHTVAKHFIMKLPALTPEQVRAFMQMPEYEPPPKPVIEEFWSPEPVIAWRAYDYQMRPLTYRDAVVYKPGDRFVAEHNRPDRPSHHSIVDCTCGFYALRTKWEVVDHLFSHLKPFDEKLFLIGPVALYGKVIEHELGYRASKVTILPPESMIVIEHNRWRSGPYIVYSEAVHNNWDDTVMLPYDREYALEYGAQEATVNIEVARVYQQQEALGVKVISFNDLRSLMLNGNVARALKA